MTERNAYAYKSTLKEVYGLTDAMIGELGAPDKTMPNPHYRSGPASALYLVARVEAWIDANRERWEAAQQKRAQRSATSNAAAGRKRAELVAWAEGAQIAVQTLPDRRTLEALTVQQGDAFLVQRGRYGEGFTLSENAVIAFIRHNLTNYEALLSELAGKIGGADAYVILRERVDAEIGRLLEGGASCQHGQ